MKTYSSFLKALWCLVLLLLLSSDWVIQGTGALKCNVGWKCEGAGCSAQSKKDSYLAKNIDCNPTYPDAECVKTSTTDTTAEGKDYVWSSHDCGHKGGCDKHQALRNKIQDPKDKIKTTCVACSSKNCNGAPISAPGLGFVMMMMVVAAAPLFTSSVVAILGM